MRGARLPFDKGVLGALFSFGLLLFVATFWIGGSTSSPTDLGAKFAPRIFSGALAIFSAAAFFFAERGEATPPADLLVPGTMLLATLYAVALPRLGYVASTFATLVVLLRALRTGAWWRVMSFALALTGVAYLVFQRLLAVGLPRGPWGF